MTIDELKAKIHEEISLASSKPYFPGCDSEREGYVTAMMEVLLWLRDVR
jgi:hypothetical protein